MYRVLPLFLLPMAINIMFFFSMDSFSHFTWLFSICSKYYVTIIFLNFQKLLERLFDKKIKSLQRDWGGEYRGLHNILVSQGITHNVTCPHTHHQNGLVEHKHHHLVETGLSLLAHSSFPLFIGMMHSKQLVF